MNATIYYLFFVLLLNHLVRYVRYICTFAHIQRLIYLVRHIVLYMLF